MLNTLLTRRSIRKYLDTPVGADDMHTILRAAMHAPSACDKRPWHFIVCDRRERLDEIRRIHPYAGMLATAPCAVLICGDTRRECAPGYYMIDCALAAENMVLAAHAAGLGSCILGVAPREDRMQEMTALFGLPPHIKPHCLVALGHADEQRATPDRYDITRIHYDRWQDR